MVGPWAYGGFEGRHVDRWLSSCAGWSADVLCGVTMDVGGYGEQLIGILVSVSRKGVLIRN